MFFLPRPEPSHHERSRGSRRRWTVYPPAALKLHELEGVGLLDEVAGSLGLLLFQRFRDLYLWATSPVELRAGLFAEQQLSDLPAWVLQSGELEEVFAQLVEFILKPIPPNDVSAAKAASRISEWGAKQGYVLTETAFAVVAALVRPEDPDLAFAAGRVARRHSDYARATDWFKRAIGLARRTDDEAAKAAAYLGWALMEAQRGRPEDARRKLIRAWKTAKRGKLRALAAAARHNLIALSVPNFEQGQGHIVAAYKLYGNDPPLIARLAVDAAAFWSLHSYFAAALRVSEAALPYIERPAERLQVLANIARSAAAVGKPDQFFSVWNEVSGEGKKSAGEFLPQIYLDLAEAARTLGYARQARELANQAAQAARERREPAVEAAAAALLSAIQSGTQGDVARDPPPELTRFARRLLRRLRRAAPS